MAAVLLVFFRMLIFLKADFGCATKKLVACNFFHLVVSQSIGLKVELPMILEMDKKGAVDLVNNFSVGSHTQHINVEQCFLQGPKEAKVWL